MSTEYASLGFKVDSSGLMTADHRLERVTRSGKQTEQQVGMLNKSFSGLTSTLGLATTALGLIGAGLSVKSVIDYSDAWSNVNSQLRQVTSSEDELISTRSKLLKITQDTRSELTNTVDLYATMTRSTKDLNISSERLMGVTKTLNNLFVSGGKPISEVEGAIRQLNQGLAAGALRGDEFNSVAEGAPKVMDALAAKLNKTRGELREFAATGGITSKILISALEDYQSTAQKLADQTAKTFGQNLQNATTNITEFIGNSKTLNGAVSSLGSGIESLSKNLDSLASAGSALVSVVGIGLTPVMYKYVASLAATAQAQLLAGTTATRTANAFGVVTTTAASATVATNALGVASRFLMGPWGLLIAGLGAAYTAFSLTSSEMDEATKKANEQADAVSRLEKIYAAMTNNQLGQAAVEAQKKAMQIDKERLEIQEKLANYSAPTRSGSLINTSELKLINQYGENASELKSRLEELNKESADVEKTVQAINKAFNDGVASSESTANAIQKVTSEQKKSAQSYADIVKSLENERQQLILTSDEFEIYMVMQQASANQWTPAMTEQIINQTRALQEQRTAIQSANIELEGMMSGDLFGFGGDSGLPDMDSELESIIDQVDNFGGAWSRTGNQIVDAMGSAASAMSDYIKRIGELEKQEEFLNTKREKYKGDKEKLAKVDKNLMKVANNRALAEISGYRAASNAAQSMFSEKTAAYKAFNVINQALSMAEIALNYQKITAGSAATTAHVAQEGTKQGANALTAITSAFAAPFPVNFAMGAAMIGIMSSLLGGSFGGGGGGYTMPEEGGAGTVLGDSSAQSQSIVNSADRFEDIQVDQLSELMGIRKSMTKLSSGIAQLTQSFAANLNFTESGVDLQNSNFLDTGIGSTLRKIDPVARVADWIDSLTGDFLGLGGIVDKIFGGFSSKKQKLIDSGISFMSQTMQDIFESGELDANMYQVVETTKKKFWGLSKKTSTSTTESELGGAINEQMGNIFGYIGETVISAAESLGLEATHIITTGLETLSLEDALKTFEIKIGDISFLDKTGDEIQQELQAIFSQQGDLMAEYLVPSIKEYQQVGEGAFETLQRVAYEQAVFNDALERTGMSLSGLSSLMQIDVAQSIITLTGGLEQFSELSNSFFESFYSEAEQLEHLEKSLSEAFGSLGLSMVDSRAEFKNLVNGIDISTQAGQELYATLLQLVPGMDDYLSALEKQEEQLASSKRSLEMRLLDLQGESLALLAMRREQERAATDESLHGLLDMIYALEDAKRAEKERKEQLEQLASSKRSLEMRLLDLQGESLALLAMRREQERAATDESLHSLLDMIYALEDAKRAEKERKEQLEQVRDAEIARINETLKAAENSYKLTLESINAQRDAYNTLIRELKANVANAETALNASLNAELKKYDDLISASEANASAEIDRINQVSSARLSALNSELSIVAGIASKYGASSATVSATEALRAARSGNFEPANRIGSDSKFTSAIDRDLSTARDEFALNEIGKLADARMSDLERSIAATESSAERQIQSVQDASKREVEALEKQKLAIEEQVRAVLGIDDSVLSLDAAIAQYEKAQADLQAELAKDTLSKLDAQEQLARESIEQARESAELQIEAANAMIEELTSVKSAVIQVGEKIAAEVGSIKIWGDVGASPSNMIKNDLPANKDPISEITKKLEQSNEQSKRALEASELASREVVKNTKSTARILQRMELNRSTL